MTQDGSKRKLAAILSADVKGYSILLADDEAFTIKTLKKYRSIMSNFIKQHNGRVVDSPGDNLLSEFSSVVDAVQCAVEIQKQLKKENERLAENKRLEFRIGVNIGDIVQDGDRIYGSGVNVAARIEGIADAGGICVSRNTYNQIKNKLELSFDYLGEHEVKNIKEPVRVYKVLMGTDTPKPLVEEELALPDKPSIAVLAFDNLSGDPEQEYFSDGISEEIISALSKTDQLFVIARNSSFTYKGKPVNVKQISKELGVRYVFEGSVRKSKDRVRITAQLIDATTGHHLWSERYDRELKEIFEVQDEISMKIITALQVELTEGGQMRTWAKRYKRLDVLLKVMEMRSLWRKGTEEATMRAGQVAQEVVDMAPELSVGYRQLGWYYYSLAIANRSPQENLKKAYGFATKAISLAEYDGSSYGFLSQVYMYMRQHEKAIAAGKQAIELDPNGAEVHLQLGWTLFYAGRPDEAIGYFNKAIRLDPFPSHFDHEGMGLAYLIKGNYEKAITELKKALQLAPVYPPNHLRLSVAYSLLGREEEARASAEKALELDPHLSVSMIAKIAPYKNQADLELILTGMRKAGFPE
ncbi:MAG: tetratricopeptide repeat protein [Deltaproteobacteria bacterium]|jgi:adenylate cyclase|nr:tetratricopeptide repeat protein [Deltaproteobacteria bacterium]